MTVKRRSGRLRGPRLDLAHRHKLHGLARKMSSAPAHGGRCASLALAACLVLLVLVGGATAAEPDLRLVTAAQEQNAATVRALLHQGADVNTPRADGATALHWAAHWDALKIADLLLDAGADANAAEDQGVTPLVLACENASTAMVSRLLSAGARADAGQANGVTPLMMAARTGAFEIVRTLLAHGVNVAAVIPTTGQTALMWATAEGHIDVMRALITAGADVGAPSAIGFTPLLFATRNGDIEAATTLIAAGADVNQPGADGTHPLPLAIVSGHDDLARLLLDRGADPNGTMNGVGALHAAVGNVDMWLRDWLRARRVSVFTQATAGLEPSRRPGLVQTLLDRGADPNTHITASTTVAPYVSGKYGAFGISSVGTGDLRGATPLWVAAYVSGTSGDATLRIIETLLDAGADLRVTSDDGTTPLMAAAGLGSSLRARSPTATKAVRMLVEAGADVRAVNEADFTALHGAAFRGSNDVIQYLVDQGADINARDFRGRTPYRIAEGAQHPLSFHEWPKTAAFLASLGADTALGVPENIGRQQLESVSGSGGKPGAR